MKIRGDLPIFSSSFANWFTIVGKLRVMARWFKYVSIDINTTRTCQGKKRSGWHDYSQAKGNCFARMPAWQPVSQLHSGNKLCIRLFEKKWSSLNKPGWVSVDWSILGPNKIWPRLPSRFPMRMSYVMGPGFRLQGLCFQIRETCCMWCDSRHPDRFPMWDEKCPWKNRWIWRIWRSPMVCPLFQTSFMLNQRLG